MPAKLTAQAPPGPSGEASVDFAQISVDPDPTRIPVSQSSGATAGGESSRPPGGQDESKAPAIASTTGKGTGSDKAAKKDETQKKKEKRGEIVVAPLPMSSPALGTGIVPIFGYIFPFNKNDEITPPSVVGAAGLITNGGSRALALAAELYLRGGAYQVTGLGLTGHLDYGFYGTGTDAGNAGRKLDIQQGGQLLFGEVLRRLGHKFYFGPRAWVAHSVITPNLSKSDSDAPDIPTVDLNIDVKAFGLRLQRDSRTNRFFPTDGTLFDVTSNFFFVSPSVGLTGGTSGQPAPIQGSNFQFQSYRLDFNKYAGLRKGQVLAYNLSLCATFGEAPFYGQCIFGANNELRGYTAGQYIDRFMFATQLEYRVDLPKRFGLAVFGGVGEVAPAVGKFNYDNLLPAIGAGPRFILSTKYHVNLRLDVAQGKSGHTWSMSVGEAF
jgi:Omp85 superfamily domain